MAGTLDSFLANRCGYGGGGHNHRNLYRVLHRIQVLGAQETYPLECEMRVHAKRTNGGVISGQCHPWLLQVNPKCILPLHG